MRRQLFIGLALLYSGEMLFIRPLMLTLLAGMELTNTALFADPIVLTLGPVSSSAGVDDQRIYTSVSEQLLVTTTSFVTLTYEIPANGEGPDQSDCKFASNGGYCQGFRNDSAFLSDTPPGFVNLSGNYTFASGGEGNDFGPVCGFQPSTSCSFTLNPGVYTFTTSISDDLVGFNGATALSYTEGFSGILTVTSGNVQVFVPEPETGLLLFFGVAAGYIARWRRRGILNR